MARGWLLGAICIFIACAPCNTHAFWWRKPKAPSWVTDPASVRQTYPQNRYLIGFGVCGGPNTRDVMSRKQAENNAISDIASYVEIQINDVVEQHDATVMRNEKELVQSVTHQQTRREVTGLLSGVEIKEIFFDARALQWHAMAVLERAKAARGALEAVDRRLSKGQGILEQKKLPLADYLDLRSLGMTVDELERLVIAVALFSPARSDAVKARVEAFKDGLGKRLTAAGKGVAVRVVVTGQGGTAEKALLEDVERLLKEHGIRTGAETSNQVLDVTISIRSETQHGTVRLYNVESGARYVFREGAQELAGGEVEAGDDTASRSDLAERARERSIEKLRSKLTRVVAAELSERFGLVAESL